MASLSFNPSASERRIFLFLANRVPAKAKLQKYENGTKQGVPFRKDVANRPPESQSKSCTRVGINELGNKIAKIPPVMNASGGVKRKHGPIA